MSGNRVSNCFIRQLGTGFNAGHRGLLRLNGGNINQWLKLVKSRIIALANLVNRGTPFRKACLKGGARAVPAGGIANPHPGGSGAPLGRQKDRSAGSPLDWTSVRQAKHLLLPRPRKRGSGAESAGYGRIGECRGRAPEGERAPNWRASAPVHFRMATSDCVARTVDGVRLSALRLPLMSRGEPKELCCRGRRQTSGADRVARTNLLIRPRGAKRSGGGGPCGAWWKGRPAQMNDFSAMRLFRCRRPFHRASARSPPHLRGGG